MLFLVVLNGYATAESETESLPRLRAAPFRNTGGSVIDGIGTEYVLISDIDTNGLDERKVGSGRVSVSAVAFLTLAMAAATGLGALPFFFVELDPQWAGICNGMAAGVLLATSFDLIQEGQECGSGNWVVFGILTGGIFFWLCKKFLEQYGEVSMLDIKGADATKAILVVGIMTLHSFGEGSGVGVSFAGSKGLSQGLLVTLAIAVRNVPEGLAVDMVLASRGVSPQNAMLWSVITSLPQPIAAVPSFICADAFNKFQTFCMGLAAGCMIWMVIDEVLPDGLKMDENNSDDNQETKMWTARSETKLINMLRDEVRKNQTTGRTTSWTIRHWNHYANQLHNLYGFRYTATKVRQKYQRLKADYQTFKRLRAQTDLGWDPIVGTVVAPDEFWDKANRNVKKFRTKGFEYFQEMAEIVENCYATGALSRASTQGAIDSEEEDDMLNKFWNPDVGGSNAGGSNAAEAIPVDLFGDEYMDPAKGKSHKRGPTTSQTDSGRSKKSRSSGFDDVCAAFTSYVQAKTRHSRARENETEAVSAGGDDYSLDACQDALLELGDIPPVQYIKALTLFKDKEWRRFFMRTPTHLHLPMILALQ